MSLDEEHCQLLFEDYKKNNNRSDDYFKNIIAFPKHIRTICSFTQLTTSNYNTSIMAIIKFRSPRYNFYPFYDFCKELKITNEIIERYIMEKI